MVKLCYLVRYESRFPLHLNLKGDKSVYYFIYFAILTIVVNVVDRSEHKNNKKEK